MPPATQSTPNRTRAITPVAWQGWRLDLPVRWSPVKLEGDYERGYALFADLHRPRLGVRWEKPRRRGKKFNAADLVRRAMREEVGELAAAEAKPFAPSDGVGGWTEPLLFLEPDPPGRDVWASFSEQSSRLFVISHHARRRERVLPDTILPALTDLNPDDARGAPWSVFDLSCLAPEYLPLRTHRLNAGDLSLTFAANKGVAEITVRQVAVAELALQRMPIDKWLAQQEGVRHKYYRPVGEPEPISIRAEGGRKLVGVRRQLRKRRRFFWMPGIAKHFTTFALHDEQRDRLLLIQSDREETARDLTETIGWAAAARTVDREADTDAGGEDDE